MTQLHVRTARSNDGTRIAFERTGDGLPLILVVGALSTKDVSAVLAPFRAQTRLAVVSAPHVLGKPGLDPERLAVVVASAGIAARN